MRRLPLVMIPILILIRFLLNGSSFSDSPHGKSLKLECNVCHTSSGWTMDESSTFNHSETTFILRGEHTSVKCRSCHPTLVFDQAGTNCYDCHTDIHEQTLGMECERCHNENSWLVSNILEIHQQSRFPLVGAHQMADCQDCHPSASGLKFEPLSIDCFACHASDYLSATNPNHVEAGYSKHCEECHNNFAYQWNAEGINHNFFPLTGGHDISDCFRCHEQGNYSLASPVCMTCHLDDYSSTTNPVHTAVGFSTDCAVCHTYEGTWAPATFDHSTFFPLTGVHNIENCATCHVTGIYSDASRECYSCHAADYNATTNPVHADAGFSTDCALCHSTVSGWVPSTFDHSTFFPLTGVHNITDCSQCHLDGNYSTASSACFSCHESDYNATTDPNHLAAGFSTDCEICHSTTSGWVPSTFDHDAYFPIYSGTHSDVWSSCSDCHTNNSDYAVFSCIDCHEHNKTDTDNDHSGVTNYQYESNACLSCHPRGNN